jgi:phosphoserine phosphatase RsbU/P
MDLNNLLKKITHSFRNTQVGYIAECLEPVGGMTSIADVFSLIDISSASTSVPVEENEGVVGLVSLDTLQKKRKSMWESIKSSTVSDFTNHGSLIVDAMDNVERVLTVLIARKDNPFDDFLIVHNGRYLGVGSFMRLTEHITKLREMDLAKARELQKFLIRNAIEEGSGVEVKTYVKTAHELGGDFYTAFKIRDDLSLVACFDVSGKNVSASLTTSMLGAFFATLNKTENYPELTPAEIVKTLNAVVFDQTPTETYITGVLLFSDSAKGSIEYYNLGHTTVFLFANAQDGKRGIKVLNPNLMPLGIGELDDIEQNARIIPIMSGLRFFIYSDGLVDARDNLGHMYGEEELKKFLISTHKLTLDELVQELDKEVGRFTEGAVLPDDITAVAVEYY